MNIWTRLCVRPVVAGNCVATLNAVAMSPLRITRINGVGRMRADLFVSYRHMLERCLVADDHRTRRWDCCRGSDTYGEERVHQERGPRHLALQRPLASAETRSVRHRTHGRSRL